MHFSHEIVLQLYFDRASTQQKNVYPSFRPPLGAKVSRKEK